MDSLPVEVISGHCDPNLDEAKPTFRVETTPGIFDGFCYQNDNK